MIELNEVHRWYGRRGARPDALAGVSLRVPAGAVWAVVGPNGAGKSTLLSLVLGFIRASAGTIRIGELGPREYVRTFGAAYLPERFRLPDTWTVRDALHLFARLDGGGADAAAAADRLELGPHLAQPVRELSRGTLQRVGIAQAVMARRRLVVLDEPTEGLDPLWRIRLRDLIRELRDDGATILLASHDLAEVERVAQRAVLLEGGRVRDVLDTQAFDDDAAWRVRLLEPLPAITDAFPVAVPDGVPDADGATSYTVRVAGPRELTERIGALVALGGVIVAVEPVRAALEDRVRRSLDAGRSGAAPPGAGHEDRDAGDVAGGEA